MLEQLLKRTKFKDDAKEIARRLTQADFSLANIDDAPGVFGHKLYGHSTYQVVAAINEAKNLPDEPKPTSKAPVNEKE